MQTHVPGHLFLFSNDQSLSCNIYITFRQYTIFNKKSTYELLYIDFSNPPKKIGVIKMDLQKYPNFVFVLSYKHFEIQMMR